MPDIVRTATVTPRGVGRADYSVANEMSVEPLIRSYQSVYSNWQTETVNALSTKTVDVSIPLDYVAIVFDFYASAPVSHLIRMAISAVSGPVIGVVATRNGYGSAAINLQKGFGFLGTIRYTLQNFAATPVDITIGAVGVYTSEQRYNLQL